MKNIGVRIKDIEKTNTHFIKLQKETAEELKKQYGKTPNDYLREYLQSNELFEEIVTKFNHYVHKTISKEVKASCIYCNGDSQNESDTKCAPYNLEAKFNLFLASHHFVTTVILNQHLINKPEDLKQLTINFFECFIFSNGRVFFNIDKMIMYCLKVGFKSLSKIFDKNEPLNNIGKINDTLDTLNEEFLEFKMFGNEIPIYLEPQIVFFNTLADNETNKARQNHVVVNGKGSDLSKKDALQGRAKRKTITQSMMLKLIDLAKENETPELENAFWNTYYCQQNIFTADGKLFGKYCKNRFCTLCCSIRKAEIINRYYPVIKDWEEPHFVTITIKAVKEGKLKSRVNAMIRGFRRINAKHRKRHQRGTGIKLIGVKSLECNFNPVKKTYNPHLHIITANKEMAEIIVADWLKLCTPKFANKKGQKIEKTYDIEKNLIEVIKYGTKIFTEPDLKKRAKETTSAQIYIKALNNILVAMKGKRIFDRFGFDLPKSHKEQKTPATLLTNFKEWQYEAKSSDWENVKTGELLSGYKIPTDLQALLENNINLDIK